MPAKEHCIPRYFTQVVLEHRATMPIRSSPAELFFLPCPETTFGTKVTNADTLEISSVGNPPTQSPFPPAAPAGLPHLSCFHKLLLLLESLSHLIFLAKIGEAARHPTGAFTGRIWEGLGCAVGDPSQQSPLRGWSQSIPVNPSQSQSAPVSSVAKTEPTSDIFTVKMCENIPEREENARWEKERAR